MHSNDETEPGATGPGSVSGRPYYAALAFALLLFVLFFLRLGSARIFDLDEGLYADCARNMAVHSNWITPLLNTHPPFNRKVTFTPFFEKPALIYWLGALAIKLAGVNALAVRLPGALLAVATVWLIYWFGKIWFNKRAALLAALVYAACPLTVLDARQYTTDGPLVFLFAVQMFSFWQALTAHRQGNAPLRTRYAVIYWVFTALAILMKGAVGMLLPPIVFVVYLMLHTAVVRIRRKQGIRLQGKVQFNELKSLVPVVKALAPVGSVLLCIVIALPWHYLVWRAGGRDELGHTWVQEYIIRQHIGRFKGLDKVHDAPMPTYFIYFLIGFFPWAGFVPAALRLTRGAGAPQRDVEKYLVIWFWVIFGGFSVAAAKLPTYIAPAYPAAALLLGRWLDRAWNTTTSNAAHRLTFQRATAAAAWLCAVLVAAAFLGPSFVPKSAPIPVSLVSFVQVLTITLLVVSGIAWAVSRFSASLPTATVIGLLTALVIVLTLAGSTQGYADANRLVIGPYQRTASAADADARRGLPVIFYHIIPRRPSMLFYIDYSPYEQKHRAFFSWAYADPVPHGGWVDVVTSTRDYQRDLSPRLNRRGVKPVVLREERGWLLLRLQVPPR